VPITRSIVKELWKTTSRDELAECIASEFHEIRLAALLTPVQQYKHAKKGKAFRQQCIDIYLENTWHVTTGT